MTALILGGTRFIGKALTRRLLEEGHEVALLTRSTEHGAAFAKNAIVHAGNRRQVADLERAAGTTSWDCVFDFLGMDGGDADAAVRALSGRTARLIHLSTGAVY